MKTTLLGLLEALESAILESPKVPFTDRTIIEETKILEIIDKIRMVVQSGPETARESIETKEEVAAVALPAQEVKEAAQKPSTFFEAQEKANEIIKKSKELARQLKFDADKYADQVLANLALTVTKILRAVENGRQRLENLAKKSEEDEKEKQKN